MSEEELICNEAMIALPGRSLPGLPHGYDLVFNHLFDGLLRRDRFWFQFCPVQFPQIRPVHAAFSPVQIPHWDAGRSEIPQYFPLLCISSIRSHLFREVFPRFQLPMVDMDDHIVSYHHTSLLQLQIEHEESEEEMPELVSDPDDDFQESQPGRSRFRADFPFAG